jgi:hypothetical protein
MKPEIIAYYHHQPEPLRSCLQGMREIIIQHDKEIVEVWKYRMPMFTFRGKMFCYLWTKRKEQLPYLGIVEGKLINDPDLIQEKRARMKILIIDPSRNIPVRKVKRILTAALKVYK